jgi:hypothetical protein
MNKLIYAFLVLTISISFLSCQSNDTTSNVNEAKKNSMKAEVNTSKFKELAVEPCNLLSEEMITNRFGIKAEDIKLSKRGSSKGKISWTAYCTYSWKKPNFEEIQKRTQEKMIESLKNADSKNAINVAKGIEKASFEVGITNLKVFDDSDKALKLFNQSHTVPEQKDVNQLKKAIDDESNEALDEEGKKVGKDMVAGIASNLKFDKVEGIGTIAYWDHLGGKLDILFGNIQIGIIMHISDDHEKNVEAAKTLAQEILKQF